jgi:glycosyltransferase involved in cell wall biosynthesis
MDISKGWLKLLGACKILEDNGIKFNCNFVGEWPSPKEENLFKEEVERLNISNCVKYLGGKIGKQKAEVFKESEFHEKFKLWASNKS